MTGRTPRSTGLLAQNDQGKEVSVSAAKCFWCLKDRRAMSEWEQDHHRDGWQQLCKPCATRRLKNPWNALLRMRKVRTTSVEHPG